MSHTYPKKTERQGWISNDNDGQKCQKMLSFQWFENLAEDLFTRIAEGWNQ
jgi:hypothetical protein